MADPTATLELKLTASTGHEEQSTYTNVTVEQWAAVCRALSGRPWTRTTERRPEPGALIVKRWDHNGAVWAGFYSGTEKDSSFDEWFPLPVGVEGKTNV